MEVQYQGEGFCAVCLTAEGITQQEQGEFMRSCAPSSSSIAIHLIMPTPPMLCLNITQKSSLI